jgi:hypothetical protein
MKNRENDFFTISLKAKRILRENRASPYVKGIYDDLCEMEHRLLKDGDEDVFASFFFSYLPRPGNPPPRTKGHVYSLCEWTGGQAKALRRGIRFLAKIGLVEIGYRHPVNPRTGKRSRKKNVECRIIH